MSFHLPTTWKKLNSVSGLNCNSLGAFESDIMTHTGPSTIDHEQVARHAAEDHGDDWGWVAGVASFIFALIFVVPLG